MPNCKIELFHDFMQSCIEMELISTFYNGLLWTTSYIYKYKYIYQATVMFLIHSDFKV